MCMKMKPSLKYRIAGIFGGIKIWQSAHFLQLANLNLANWQACTVNENGEFKFGEQ